GPSIDRRTDVWSLGAVLYFLCAGYAPFEAETKVASLMQRIDGQPPVPLPPRVPREVQSIIAKALARDPARRFADAAEMQGAIEEAMNASRELATAAEVSAFVREHLAESIAIRRAAVQTALDAASERHRKNVELEEPLEDRRHGSTFERG